MNLTEQDIEEFVMAWKKDFNETLSPEVARSEATRLLDFFAWMTEELEHQQSEKKSSPQSGGCGDVGDVGKEAWKKMMKRRLK